VSAMNTSPVTTSTPPTAATSTTAPSAVLGKDDFLKLLAGEMRNQDPMSQSNQDPSQLIAQMTQLSILEQLTNLATAQQQSADELHASQAVGLIGHAVDYTAADGTKASGTVEQVALEGGAPTLTIAGKPGIPLASVTGVR
jgi:flagellar basal-body rod modification protein FlgD